LRDNAQSISWQRIWSAAIVSNVAYFRRDYRSDLFGSEFDTPIFASQDRRHVRNGFIASLTGLLKGHTLKAGVETARLTPREFFTFAITDTEAAEEEGVSDAALEFTRTNPFVFEGRRTGWQSGGYLQDLFSPIRNLSVSAGLRYDRSNLPATDSQFSPRIGAVYHFTRTKTALRASFNRLYMPPQLENLLLADSEQARELSPFATETGGGATIRPERVSAYEAGVAQDVRGLFRLDVAYWHRTFRNFDDPNVFFNTTVIFPNSVSSGFARGLDARLDVPERKGWSGYASWGNSRVLQIGPINGGLFLTDEFQEIGPGTRFIPDHDQRNAVAFGVTYRNRRTGLWVAFGGRHESGVPLEVDEDSLEELMSAPGAELVDFERQRVKPWTVFDFSAGADLFRDERVSVAAQFDIQNVADRRFAYNFGNPFEGTHFGYPRLWSGRIKLTFH
jgi:outer membrane receptor for Fe3+-dicitrate